MGNPYLISIVGPTAVGKTDLSIKLARWLNTEIISADSRQFYREMTIGTAKPSKEELFAIPHHFINSHSINEIYSAGKFGRDAKKKIGEIAKKKSVIIAIGGSGLYLKTLWEGLDNMPEVDYKLRSQLNEECQRGGLDKLLKELEDSDPSYFNNVDKNNAQRVIRALEVIRTTGKPFTFFRQKVKNEMPYKNLKIGLNMDRKVLFERINARMDQMVKKGLFEEAQSLFNYKYYNAMQTVGYSEIFEYIEGKYSQEEAIRLLKRNSRHYAKRQLSWFRRHDDIHWFTPDQEDEIKSLIIREIY